MTVVDPNQYLKDMEACAKKYRDPRERLEAVMHMTRESAKEPLPNVEKFPAYFYEEGVTSFATTCHLRQMIAIKQYWGEDNYSFYDLIEQLAKNAEHREGKEAALREWM